MTTTELIERMKAGCTKKGACQFYSLTFMMCEHCKVLVIDDQREHDEWLRTNVMTTPSAAADR